MRDSSNDAADWEKKVFVIAAAVDRFGWIDVLVNNAGNSVLGNVKDLTTSDFQRQSDTNFFGVVRATWAAYNGTQQGDPLKLGQALVQIAGMDAPLTLFVAGSDAIEVLLPVAKARVRAIEDNTALSGSTGGPS